MQLSWPHQSAANLKLQWLAAIFAAGVKHAAVIKCACVVHSHKVASLAAAAAAAAAAAECVINMTERSMCLCWRVECSMSNTGMTMAAEAECTPWAV
jgi:hypothetical protein